MYPEWCKDKSIYEVNVRHFSKEGNLKGFRPHIERIRKMGFGIIWFMPIQPIGEKNRKGELGSPYSIKNFTEVNPNFGSLQEFKEIVEEIHKQGMYVLIDWVANHTAWDNVWTENNPDFYHRNENGEFLAPCPDWADVIHLDYSNAEMRKTMIESMKFWLNEAKIDGFRCDMAHLVPTDFWNQARPELEKVNPNLFMLAESENRDLLEHAFEACYGWKLFHTTNEIAKGWKNVHDLDYQIEHEVIGFPEKSIQMLFTSNHDENAWNGSAIERLGCALEPIALLMYTLDGLPLVFAGEETGLYRRMNFFDKDEIEWKDDKLIPFYTKLNALKTRNNALWNGHYGGQYQRLHCTANHAVLCFARHQANNAVIVVLNLTGSLQKHTLSASQFEGQYRNVMNNETYKMESHNHFIMGPWQYFIFEKLT